MNFAKAFIVKPKTAVKLSRIDSGFTAGVKKGSRCEDLLKRNISRLNELQYVLYAEARRALLVVIQAMDAGGKDGVIRQVMSGVNPQGCTVTSFKAPTPEELSHDFLWRVHKAVPQHGQIGIFNRSHYEDVLIARVHGLVPKSVWSERYSQINDFETTLSENGVTILKFFLHISVGEQKKRFLDRISDPARNWKISPADFEERKYWDDYQKAYEDALSRTSSKWAPWFIIPSDRKWFRNLAVSSIIVDALESLDMKFPKPSMDLSSIRID
jgi:PPK2 family polyphosphate:nucleotide phosphotransferase